MSDEDIDDDLDDGENGGVSGEESGGRKFSGKKILLFAGLPILLLIGGVTGAYFGAYILSLTGRFAGCRGPRLSCNAVAEEWFFRSWAVVLRSCRLTRARDCRLSS